MLIRVAAAYLAFSGLFEAGAGSFMVTSLGVEPPSFHVTEELCAVYSPPRRTESRNSPTIVCPRFWS